MVWPAGTNSLWMMVPLLSEKAISFLTVDFCRLLFFGRGEVGEYRAYDCRLIPDWTGNTMSHILWRCFREAMDPGHTWKWKSPEVSIRFALCLSVSLCCTNQEQIIRLPKSSQTMVCTMSLLMPKSWAIKLSFSRRFCASICHTFSIISGVLLVNGWLERGSSSIVSFP